MPAACFWLFYFKAGPDSQVRSAEEVRKKFQLSQKQRATATTQMNDVCSAMTLLCAQPKDEDFLLLIFL